MFWGEGGTIGGGCSGTGTGGEFELNAKGCRLENMKKSKEGVAGNSKAAKQRK